MKSKYLTPFAYQLEVIRTESPKEYEKLIKLLKNGKSKRKH